MDFDQDAFKQALTKTFRMDPDDADQITHTIAECFFGEDEVNDEDLAKETRSLFYTLEAEGLMTFRRTEYKFEGAIRRAFFWRLTEEVMNGTVEDDVAVATTEEEDISQLYARLAEDAWSRDAIHA